MKSKKLKKIIAIAIVSSITSTLMPVAASAEWLQNSTSNWSWTESGEKTTGWKQVEGTWYYFDNNGDMKTGWVQSADSKWYYLNSNGAMKTGWLQELDGKWYKLGSDGAMRTGWVQESDGNWYKLSTSGAMQTGWIQDSDNKWYFASSSGEMQTGVIQVDGKPYVLSQTGDMLVGTNVSTEGNIYTTDANGVIIQGNSSNRGIEFNKKGDPLAQGQGSGDGKQSTTTSNTQSSNTDTTTTKNNDNNSRHHNSSINITKINELNDINVANGTELSKINLPSNVTVKLDNDKEISVPVIWNEGNSNYNKNISGTYTFSGTLKLPSGIKNSSNLKATINVNVGAAGVTKKSLASIRSLPDANVNNGTSLHELSLPRNVRITLSDNTTTSAAVTWDEGTPTYDGSVSGTYTFIGQLALPDDITNPNNLTATVNVNVASANTGDREVLRVRPVSDINVNNGISLEDLDLPNRVHLTLGDNTTTSASVTWDEGTPTYDGSVAGTYIFSGELTLPEGITNPNNLKAIAQVNVASAEMEKSVIGINPIQDVNVSNGTSLDAANLPSDVIVRLDDNTTTSAAVTWDEGTPTYDESVAGTYIFSGELTLPEGITNPNNLKAIVQVNVAAADTQRSVVSVDTIPNITVNNGTSLDAANLPSDVIVRLDDNTTTSAAVTWNEGTPTYDGEAAGTYRFDGTLTLPEGITNPNNLKATANVIVANPMIATGMTVIVEPKTTPEDGRLMLTVTPEAEDANHKVYYRILDGQPTPMNVGAVINPTDWTELSDTLPHEISAENGMYVEVVEVTTDDNKVTKWGKSSETNDGYVAPTVPTAKVSNLAFTDTDVNANEMGGTLTWTAPTDESNVTSYAVYSSTDGTTKGEQIGRDVAVGTNQLVIPADTEYTPYVIVVAKNAVGEAECANYSSVRVTDVALTAPTVTVWDLTFTDADTDTNQIGGILRWTEPTDVSNVTSYAVYTSVDGRTKGGQIGEDVPVGTNQLVIPENTLYTPHIIVVTKNAAGESRFFTGILVRDLAPTVPTAKVSNLAFTDTDNDSRQMGGTLTWNAPTDESNVTGYAVYASTDGTTKGAQIGSDVSKGTNQLVISADTEYTPYIIVVAKNAIGEAVSSNYAKIGVTDVMPTAVKVSNDSVTGATAGDAKITGLISGRAYKITDNSTGISEYTKADGTLTADVSQESALGEGITEITGLTNGTTYKVEEIKVNSVAQLNDITVVNGTQLDSLELPNKVSITLSENRVIDAGITWDIASANYYGDIDGTYTFNGTIALPIGVINPSNFNTKVNVIVSKNITLNKTATANSWNLQVEEAPSKAFDGYTNTKWCSTKPGDNWLELDLGKSYEIGRWVVKHAHAGNEPATWNTSDFKLQKRSDDGLSWIDVDSVTGNTADITDRNVNPFTARYVRLYVTNPVQPGEWAVARIDEFELYKDQNPTVPTVKVSNLAFTDTDNDSRQIGGTLTWNAPTDESNVTSYAVYASTDGTTKGVQIGSDVLKGTNQLVIPQNTAYTTNMIVVAKNATGEAAQANYANIRVMDVAPTLTAPTLVAQSNANVDNDIEITFTDNEAWRNAVTDVQIDGQSVGTGNWTLSAGKLTLTTHKAGNKKIKVIATGYTDAIITQYIAFDNLSIDKSTVKVVPNDQLPNGEVLAAGHTSTVTITAKDKYDNPISNKQFKLDMNVTNKNSSTREAYTINNILLNGFQASYSARLGLDSTNDDGESSFEISIPNQVDAEDGFTIDIKDKDTNSQIGQRISFFD
ncbi:Ig-like domain-containing protein [Clostridium saccharobutylicum]|uniref:Putative cell wall binding protein n=6 Tax=Clostridium saccharobutylicum TaxID=169679 RepID=U5MU99_CLOSA|nr:Ig-like domain-containing protein [Clostridium saccharobutylicum]AGX44364.1 putative cell wall binding protein [Clostridium saccharobutylicum DSM 13864]AQR91657.1 autolysin [Clostridium saccharobutylicum]AQS01561.1 autolysin [Clostridium saccharobutylicum]AQS15544.1 autolysin [Clostridium saccharobutylicum]MBA2907260.1 glucan-binding YG repeat protein [Clostridium saccharobutylicum]